MKISLKNNSFSRNKHAPLRLLLRGLGLHVLQLHTSTVSLSQQRLKDIRSIKVRTVVNKPLFCRFFYCLALVVSDEFTHLIISDKFRHLTVRFWRKGELDVLPIFNAILLQVIKNLS